MNEYEFYKELYFHENERRQEVVNSLNIPIALLTALGSILYYIVVGYDFKNQSHSKWLFLVPAGLTSLLLLVALFYIVMAFSRLKGSYEYKGLPYPNDLAKWKKDLEIHFQNNEEADKHYKAEIVKGLVEHTTHNMFVNDKKHSFIFNAKRALIASIVLTIISVIPFGINFFDRGDSYETFEIKLISPGQIEIRPQSDKYLLNYDSIQKGNDSIQSKRQNTPAASTTTEDN